MNNNEDFMLVTEQAPEYELDIDNLFNFTEGGVVALIDADPIAYAAASACEQVTHKVSINGRAMFEIQGGVTELYASLSVENKAEFTSLLEGNPSIHYERSIKSDNPDNMFHTIKSQVSKIVKTTKAGSIKLYLTKGSTNFRLTEEISTILKYKGNRPPDAKPKLLQEARDYLVDILGAEICEGMEADDRLSIEHNKYWEEAMVEAEEYFVSIPVDSVTYRTQDVEEKALQLSKSVLVTIDKDIKMRAGKFLNPSQDLGVEDIYPLGHLNLKVKVNSKGVKENDLKFSGLRGFYAQILMGDKCDNIAGVYYSGDKSTYEVLKDCQNEEQLFKATLSEIYEGFHREHIKFLDEEICSRVESAIALGAKDTKSNRTKLRAKYKRLLIDRVAYGDKHYYHWSEYSLKEDGTVSRILTNPEEAVLLSITPLDYMIQIAKLLYMLVDEISEDGSHHWKVPVDSWAEEVISKYDQENLERIPMVWSL